MTQVDEAIEEYRSARRMDWDTVAALACCALCGAGLALGVVAFMAIR